MAGKTLHEVRIELSNQITALTGLVNSLREVVNGQDAEQDKASDALADLKTGLALLQQQFEDLKKGREEWGRRGWALIPPLVAAVIGGLIGYLLRRP